MWVFPFFFFFFLTPQNINYGRVALIVSLIPKPVCGLTANQIQKPEYLDGEPGFSMMLFASNSFSSVTVISKTGRQHQI